MPAASSALQRRAWVEAYARTRDAAAVCATFGISRPTLRKWCARHDRHGKAGLESASPVPRRSPGRKLFPADRSDLRDWQSENCSLAQMQRRLAERGVSVSIPTIRRALAGTTGAPPAATPVGAAGPSLFDTLIPDDTLFRALADRITSGSLRPGDTLDGSSLAREHRAGRRSIRAAIRSLAAIGLVAIAPGNAAVVTAPPVQMIADAYAARRLLEIEIVRDLAAWIGPGEIARLRQHVRQQADAERRGDKVTVVRLLTDFHLLLATLSGNVFLRSFVQALASVTALGVLVYDQDAAPSCAVDDHRALIRALERHDAAGAALLMSDHLGHNHARQRPGR